MVNPDDVVNEYGADTLRMYEMFIGDFEKSVPWSTDGVRGCRRFLDRVWKLQPMLVRGTAYSSELETLMHQTIKKVSNDYEELKFNTAIAQLMTFVNEGTIQWINEAEMKTFLILFLTRRSPLMEGDLERLGFPGAQRTSWPTTGWKQCQTIAIGVRLTGEFGAITVNIDDPVEVVGKR